MFSFPAALSQVAEHVQDGSWYQLRKNYVPVYHIPASFRTQRAAASWVPNQTPS